MAVNDPAGDPGLIAPLRTVMARAEAGAPQTPSAPDRRLRPVPRGAGRLSTEAMRAWDSSTLTNLTLSRDMLESASEMRVSSGESIFQFNDPRRLFLGIMVTGVARVYTRSPQGRQVTIRYTSDGDWLGLPLVLAPRAFSMALAVQALSQCHLLRLSIPVFRRNISRNVDNMWCIVEELARSMATNNTMLAENVFLPVRSRVARHLLDLAQLENSRWVVQASQQDVADAIGSVREVVSRAILSLRDEGLLHRDGSSYVLDSPADLHRLTVAAPSSATVG